MHNNPIRLLINEANQIWGPHAKFACVLSIGTGAPPLQPLGHLGHQVLMTCTKKATETETTAKVFKSEHRHGLVREGKYFRFNVAQGLQNVRLEEWEVFDLIDASTKNYLGDVLIEIQQCADAVKSVPPPLSKERE